MLQTRLILALACLPLARAGVTSLTVPLTGSLGAIQLSGFVHTVTETTSPTDPCRFHANLAGVTGVGDSGQTFIGVGAVAMPVDPCFGGGFFLTGTFALIPTGNQQPPRSFRCRSCSMSPWTNPAW